MTSYHPTTPKIADLNAKAPRHPAQTTVAASQKPDMAFSCRQSLQKYRVDRSARKFSVEAPDRVWTGDITYLWTDEGWLYLAVVIDLFSRQVVGFAMSERMTRKLVIDALRMAWFRRRPESGLIFHSDRGSQYASGDFQKQLSIFGMRGSMSRKGDCWDNAVTETLFGSLKVERLHGMRFATRRQAKDEGIDWMRSYNHRRLHSTLGYLSPMAFEKKWLADKERLAA
jgi:transposase InsO family protein